MNLRVFLKLAFCAAMLGFMMGGLGLWVAVSEFWGRTARVLMEWDTATRDIAVYCDISAQVKMLYFLMVLILAFGFILGWTWSNTSRESKAEVPSPPCSKCDLPSTISCCGQSYCEDHMKEHCDDIGFEMKKEGLR